MNLALRESLNYFQVSSENQVEPEIAVHAVSFLIKSNMVKLFGSTFEETISIFKRPLKANGHLPVSSEDRIKVIARLIITFILLITSVYCLVSGNKELGGTLLGAITGYWLK